MTRAELEELFAEWLEARGTYGLPSFYQTAMCLDFADFVVGPRHLSEAPGVPSSVE